MKYIELLEDVKNNVSLDTIFDKVEIKYTLSFNAKYFISKALAENLLDTREDGIKYISLLKKNMICDLLLLKFTNIEKDDAEYNVNDYDLLKSYGFYKHLYSKMTNVYDYLSLVDSLQEEAKQLVEQHNIKNSGINAIVKQTIDTGLDKIVEQYNSKDGRKAIKSFLKDLNENNEIKEFIDDTLTRMNLDYVKDELLTRIKKSKEVERIKKTKETEELKK